MLTNNVLLRVSTSSLSIWCVCSDNAAPKEDSGAKHLGFTSEVEEHTAPATSEETGKGYPQGKTCLGTSHRSRVVMKLNAKRLKLGGDDEMLQEESFVCFANLYKPVQNTTFELSRK